MTTAYTNLLGLALPVQGELTGTWGDTINNSITSLLEDAIANFATHDVTSGNWTLTTTGSGVSNEARMAMLVVTGTPGVTRTITAPGHSKMYLISNQSNAAVTVKSASTSGVTIAAGQNTIVAWNNVDFVEIKSTQVLNLAGGSAGAVPYQSAANTTAFTAVGTVGQVLTSNGTSPPTWQAVGSSSANITGGAASQIPYQSAPSTTTFIANGTTGQYLKSNGTSAPAWSDLPTTISTASNLAGGSAGTIPYQTASGTTAMLGAGTSGYFLKSNGAGAPSWAAISSGGITSVNGYTGPSVTLSYSDVGAQIAGSYVSPSVTSLTSLITVGGTNGDVYDLNIQSSGGNTTYVQSKSGGNIYGAYFLGHLGGTTWTLCPFSDNATQLGASGNRWSVVYAATGTINTSDERLKTEQPYQLGLEFIKQLKPRAYKWKVGGSIGGDIPEGFDVNTSDLSSLTTPVPGKRIHYGLFAQEVKQTLDTLGVTDFGGWVSDNKDDPEATQSLRYDQFIAPLIKAIQEQQTLIEDLQTRLTSLGG